MVKRFGDTPTHLALSAKAQNVYDNTDPCDILEYEDIFEGGCVAYSYTVNICGDIRENLNAFEVNTLLEELADVWEV